jgi:predicted Ser/Thr protein kinase
VAVELGVLPSRYGDVRLIAQGGMGEVFLAEDRELGRKVAVKLLDTRFSQDEQLRRRFKREALTAARLSGHPHVVTIYDVGEWRGRPFIVMEYLSGGALADRARSAHVDRTHALTWLGQAAEALDAADELGIVHRDVKPANLLIDARGQLTVGDFGIARAVDDTTGGLTAAGTVLGTAGYLAPEQALGQAATSASDRYALAVVAYELLTGGRPFERGSATAEAAAHIHEPVPPASQRGVGLPQAVDRVFERALAKDPAARYPTADAFVSALAAALAASAEPTRVLPAVVPASGRGGSPGSQRSLPWLPLLLAALLLALLGGVAAAVFSTRGGGAPASTTAERQQVTVTTREVETRPGTTVVETVTTVQAAPPPTSGPVTVEEAVRLTDEATFALRRGDWEEATQLARQALPALEGTYSDAFRYEAYVNFDLGKALAELGRCSQALRYLDRSEELQGERAEIDAARSRCGGDD